MTYDAVLLDNDGVLTALTEEAVLARAVRDAFRDMGVPDPDHRDVTDLVVGVTPSILADVADRYNLDPDPFWRRRDVRASLVQERELKAGRKPLYDDVYTLSEIDLPMGIVSSNQHRTIEAILDHHGLRDRFKTYYGREMAVSSLARKKPATYYLDRAVTDLEAQNPLFVGDSESDVQAAAAAEMDAVFIRRPHRAEVELAENPTHEIRSLTELSNIIDSVSA